MAAKHVNDNNPAMSALNDLPRHFRDVADAARQNGFVQGLCRAHAIVAAHHGYDSPAANVIFDLVADTKKTAAEQLQ